MVKVVHELKSDFEADYQQLTGLLLWCITLQIAHSSLANVLVSEPLPLDVNLNRSLEGPSIDIPAAGFLSKRQLSWTEAVAKGTRLLCRIQNPALLNDQSRVTSTDMLATNGWTRVEEEVDFNIFPTLDPFFDQERVDNFPWDCKCVCWEHTESSTNSQGQDVPATQGRYTNVFNTRVGFILAYNNFGAAWMVRDRENKILPDIRAWSDVVFLEWKTQAQANGHDVQGLKYVIRYEIVNQATLIIAERAAGLGNRAEWPGLTFFMHDDSARAVLGTSNGVGVAYLLATHKEQLGDKTIESTQLWWKPIRSRSTLYGYALFIAFRIGSGASSSGSSITG